MAVALKLYTGSHHDQVEQVVRDDPKRWTIRQAFERSAKPYLERQGRARTTIQKWAKAVWYWEQCRPDDPPICSILRADLDEFPLLILDESHHFGIRTNTAANQQLMYLNAILRLCDDVLEHVPRGRNLPVEAPTRTRRFIDDNTLAGIYSAAGRAATLSHDRRIPAGLLWQTLLVLLCSIGCRRTEAAMMPRTAIVRDRWFPDLPGFDVDAESAFGWLVFHTPKTRAKKHGLPLVLPMSEPLRRHLDELDRLAPNRKRIFPIGNHGSTWRKEFHRIQREAGVVDLFCFQDLRKTANRRFRRAADREIAAFMLGHQPRGVNATFYDDLTADAVKMVHSITWPRGFAG